MILIISLGLVLREYANIMGGGFNYSVSQSLQVPITIIIGLWMVLFVASYLVLAVKPVVDVLTKTRGRNKTISWLKSLALILVVTGFLTLLLFPSVSIKQVVGVLAFGLVLLSLGIFLELPHREKTGTKAETDQFGKRKNL
jgi:fatty acid desaturase